MILYIRMCFCGLLSLYILTSTWRNFITRLLMSISIDTPWRWLNKTPKHVRVLSVLNMCNLLVTQLDPKRHHHFPGCGSSAAGAKYIYIFFYLKMQRFSLGPNQPSFQPMRFTLRADRSGRKAHRPRLRMSGTINPVPIYVFIALTAITLQFIYIPGGSRQSALYSLKPGSITEMSIQQCLKISDRLCRDSEAESRSRCS
jgi:hypothetical protein